MIKQKRVRCKKNDADEPQTPTTLPPKDTSNPFAKWMFGLAVLSLLVIGGPVALWAQTETPDTSRVSFTNTTFQNFKENLSTIQKSFEGMLDTAQLVKTVSDLSSEVTALKTKQTTCKEDVSRMDCLNVCRKNLAACDSTGMKPTASGMDPCLSQTNECITKCNYAPRPSVSCEDRCSVALGGCVERVMSGNLSKDQGTALEICRMNNRNCLVKACKYTDETKLPSDYCPDQCKRLDEICTAGSAKGKSSALATCNKLKTLCEDKLCTQSSNCSADQIKECSDIYVKYSEASNLESAQKMQEVCLSQCKSQIEVPKQIGTPAKCTPEQEEKCQVDYKTCNAGLDQKDQTGSTEVCFKALGICKSTCQPENTEAVSSCDENQQYMCDKVQSRCMDIVKSEDVCKDIGKICANSCASCSVEKISACHTQYSACSDKDCYYKITDCLSSCSSSAESSSSGSAESPAAAPANSEQTGSPTAAPAIEDEKMTCYKTKCEPEYQQCQIKEDLSMDECQNILNNCKNTCYGLLY